MGLIDFAKRFAAGHTDFQKRHRYDRANARATDYMNVVQWYAENSDESPLLAQDYDALARMPYHHSHRPLLARYKNDIIRKLGHASHIGTRQNPWISVFLRPTDDTVYCAYVLLRDDTQQFAVMKPYWFLLPRESEADFKSEVPNMI